MERIYRTIVERPWRILVMMALATAFLGYHAARISVDSSVEALLPEDDPARRYYAEVRTLFGSDEVGVVMMLADDVYRTEVLQKLARLTIALEQIDGVKSVVSLANAPDLYGETAEALRVSKLPPLMANVPGSAAGLAELRRKVLERPIVLKNLVSEDGKAAAINVFFADVSDEEFLRRGVDRAVEAALAKEQGPERLYYSGLPHFKVHMAGAMWRDLARFVPLCLAAIVVVLYSSFRSLRGVLLPAATVVVSLVWTLGIIVLSGGRLSLATTSLPPLILVIGAAYALHVVAEYYDRARRHDAAPALVLEVLRRIGTPVFIAAATTVLGFAAIGFNRIASIRQMGLYSAVGITIAFVLSVVLVPALLTVLPVPARAAGRDAPRLAAALRRLGTRSIRHRRAVIAAGGALFVLGALPIPFIHVDSDFRSFFDEDDPVRVATDAISDHLAASAVFYVTIDGREHGLIKKWDVLRRIKELQRFIDGLPGIDKTISFVDFVEAFDRGAQMLREDDLVVGPDGEVVPAAERSAARTFWQNPDQLAAALKIPTLRPESVSLVVDRDFSRTNILVRTSLSRSSEISSTVAAIRARAATLLPPELEAHPTGKLVLLTETTHDIIAGQIESLTITAAVIFAIMAAMFLSLRVGLIAMVPNVFPIVMLLGLLGVTGTDLNLATNMIASIALGIAVDDTIHLMSRLSSEVRRSGEQEAALLESLSSVGKPALYASLLVVLGFLTLVFSSFVPIRQFGMLSAATIVFAVLGEIVLTPALLASTRIVTIWDVLRLRLGSDPQKTIGIFHDLRPWQAKIVALMGELRSFSRGQPIIRQGDVSTAMFVIIDGRAEVSYDSGTERRHVRELGRGDVFGEMGLIRRHRRVADVLALDDVETVAMDERFLSRLQRRYPRIASRVLANVARVLADRLESETARIASGVSADNRVPDLVRATQGTLRDVGKTASVTRIRQDPAGGGRVGGANR